MSRYRVYNSYLYASTSLQRLLPNKKALPAQECELAGYWVCRSKSEPGGPGNVINITKQGVQAGFHG